MKFCRFELVEDSGTVRTGIAYEGRIYETDGKNAIGIHESSDIRLLAPIARAPAVRLFRAGQKTFDYVHPAAMAGPNQQVHMPLETERLGHTPAIAVVVAAGGSAISPAQADDLILGLCLAHVFTALRHPGGRALDAGFALGPALVTPDEFIEGAVRQEQGLLYPDDIKVIHNGVEVASYKLGEVSPRPAQAIAITSESLALTEGDVLLIPLAETDLALDPADEIRLVGAKLGSLAVRIV